MRVYLEPPSNRRRAEFLRLERSSRKLHRPWVAAPASDAAFAGYLASSRCADARSFLVCLEEDRSLAGVINISAIIDGMFKSAYLGFYAFAPAAGRGFMSEGLGQVLSTAFGSMRLHRLEANIQPGNAASLALARRLGFRKEGFSPNYLKIGGRWRDHERWAILAEEWSGGPP